MRRHFVEPVKISLIDGKCFTRNFSFRNRKILAEKVYKSFRRGSPKKLLLLLLLWI